MSKDSDCHPVRLLPAILTDLVPETREYYVRLLGLAASFDSSWFVELVSPDSPAVALGIWKRTHDLVPPEFQKAPTGFVLSFQVPDASVIFVLAQSIGAKIVVPLRDEEYGQRHFMTEDPNGILVDITTPIELSPEFRLEYSKK
jgi:catechol 2,3-dioxygenase-like lactoylglutathione lyase family enzyme